MKKFLLASAALSVIAFQAHAAEPLRSKPAASSVRPAASMVAQRASSASNWTGAYVGVNVGYNFYRTLTDQDNKMLETTTADKKRLDSGSGLLVGGQVGFDYQVSDSVVLGLVADWDYSGAAQTVDYKTTDAGNGSFATDAPYGVYSARLRAGVLLSPELLIYATGGWAGTQNHLKITVPAPYLGYETTQAHYGWTVGAGAEYMISSNVSVFAEYRYSEYFKASYSDFMKPTTVAPSTKIDYKVFDQQVRVGVNYRFSTGN